MLGCVLFIKKKQHLLLFHLGVDLKSNSGRSDDNRFSTAHKINFRAAELYHNYLLSEDGKNGISYLTKRGVTKESLLKFNLGLAPDSWNFLANQLKKSKLIVFAEELGLVNSKDKEKDKDSHYYDKFRNRIIFPISNEKGKVVAFGGRDLGLL